MTILNLTSRAARPRMCPVAHVIASRPRIGSHQHMLALRGFEVATWAPEDALVGCDDLPACALLLVETTGLNDPVVASLVTLAAARRRKGSEVIFICSGSHVDFLGALIGTGATYLCEPRSHDLDRALQDAARVIWLQRMRYDRPARRATPDTASLPPRPWPQADGILERDRPFWLDILSDLLTDLAIAQQANDPQGRVIGALLEQMIERLLASLPDGALIDGFQDTSLNEGNAELARLAAELTRRDLVLTCLRPF